jgi:hypothetical protein
MAKCADASEGVWALLAGGAEDDEGGVVLLAEELEGGGILEWVDLVLLGELLGEWPP